MYNRGKDNYYDKLIEQGYGNYNREQTLGIVNDPKSKYYLPGSQTAPLTGAFDYSIGVE